MSESRVLGLGLRLVKLLERMQRAQIEVCRLRCASPRTAGRSCHSVGGGDRLLSSGRNTEGSGTAMTDQVTARSNQEETLSADHARLSQRQHDFWHAPKKDYDSAPVCTHGFSDMIYFLKTSNSTAKLIQQRPLHV